MDFATVFTTFSSAEAQLIRSRLEAAGFFADVHNELAALSTEGYSSATGGIKVVVPEDQAADARALLDAENSTPLPDGPNPDS
jgi:hypothetical protein